jgi:squalene synthase HpnC
MNIVQPASKTHKGENFPVASFVLKPAHRPTVMAFYAFARTADDIADSPTLPPDEKLHGLEILRSGLAGETADDGPADGLRAALAQRGLLDSAVHGLDLLEAFRRDVTKLRYADWNDLMDYCRYSAAPVGRFVLDVHGESKALWPQNDALCSALQVINHLQDCGKDYREINRVYVPLDALGAIPVEALGATHASPELRTVIIGLARRTAALLDISRPFADGITDNRLAFEVAFIQKLAESLVDRLLVRDPLSERVHHNKWEMGALGLATLFRSRSQGSAS